MNMMVWKDNWMDNEVIMEDGWDVNVELIDCYYDVGWNKYEDICCCNMVLVCVLEVFFMNVEKVNFIVQVKMICVMIYFMCVCLFGKLMLVKEFIDLEVDMKFFCMVIVKEIYDFILNDFREVVFDLFVDVLFGVLLCGVVYVLLGEVVLYGVVYIENGQEEYYWIVVKVCEDLFVLDKYLLDGNYVGMFNDYDYLLVLSEIILV